MNQAQTNNIITKLQDSDLGAKKKYIKPRIELIYVDSEISLALESEPPIGPGDEQVLSASFNNSNPFNQTLV